MGPAKTAAGKPNACSKFALRRFCHASGQADTLGLIEAWGADLVLKKQNIPGLYHATASIRSLLKSGLGRFGLHKQPHPADNAVVIMFVVGGISVHELREIQQEVDMHLGQGRQSPQLLAGGTVLLRPRDLYHNLYSTVI